MHRICYSLSDAFQLQEMILSLILLVVYSQVSELIAASSLPEQVHLSLGRECRSF